MYKHIHDQRDLRLLARKAEVQKERVENKEKRRKKAPPSIRVKCEVLRMDGKRKGGSVCMGYRPWRTTYVSWHGRHDTSAEASVKIPEAGVGEGQSIGNGDPVAALSC